jgi:hypothetical protein
LPFAKTAGFSRPLFSFSTTRAKPRAFLGFVCFRFFPNTFACLAGRLFFSSARRFWGLSAAFLFAFSALFSFLWTVFFLSSRQTAHSDRWSIHRIFRFFATILASEAFGFKRPVFACFAPASAFRRRPISRRAPLPSALPASLS